MVPVSLTCIISHPASHGNTGIPWHAETVGEGWAPEITILSAKKSPGDLFPFLVGVITSSSSETDPTKIRSASCVSWYEETSYSFCQPRGYNV